MWKVRNVSAFTWNLVGHPETLNPSVMLWNGLNMLFREHVWQFYLPSVSSLCAVRVLKVSLGTLIQGLSFKLNVSCLDVCVFSAVSLTLFYCSLKILWKMWFLCWWHVSLMSSPPPPSFLFSLSSFPIFASWSDTVMELYFPACPENHELDLLTMDTR